MHLDTNNVSHGQPAPRQQSLHVSLTRHQRLDIMSQIRTLAQDNLPTETTNLLSSNVRGRN